MALVLCALLLAACGGGSGGGGGTVGLGTASSGSGGGGGDTGGGSSTTTVTGRAVDANGDGVGGALVIVGTSSATGITDDQGRFSVSGAPSGQAPVTILAPGYRAAAGTANGSSVNVVLDEDPDVDENPVVEIRSASLSGGQVSVEASVEPAPGAQIADVRVELVGTADGAVLERHGSVYQGSFPTDSSGGTITVFAIDDGGRHGQDSQAVGQVPPPVGTEETWVGSVAGVHRQGNNDGFYPFNAAVDVSADGSATGLAVFLLQAPLKLGQTPVVKVPLSGTARTTGQVYSIQLSGEPGLKFTGRVSTDGGAFSGTVSGKVQGKCYQGTFCFINTKVRPNPWTAPALAARWGLSFFYGKAGPASYQWNMVPTVDAGGAVQAGGTVTLGPSLTGGTLAFQPVDGRDLGYFVGTPGLVLDGGSEYAMHGLMGVGTKHVRGVWSGPQGVGSFWGRKNPAWAQSDLDAQWQGFFQVTAGPDQGRRLNVQVNLNPNGEVTGAGSITGTLTGGNIAIKAGTLTIADPASGKLTGTFTGKQGGADVTIPMSIPPLPETASMGVYHQRLIGKFYISTNQDSGYYFLFRNSKR